MVTEAENVGECCLLGCSPWLAQLVFSHNLGSPAHSGTVQGGLGPLTSN